MESSAVCSGSGGVEAGVVGGGEGGGGSVVESDGIIGGGAASGGMVIKAPMEHSRIRINKWRVREGFPVSASQVILLYEVMEEPTTEPKDADRIVHKLKASTVGVVKKRLFKDGDTVEKGAALLELSECVHTTVIKDMCADCGADLRQNENGNTSEASVPMVHSIPDLKVTQKLAQKLGHDDTRRLLQDRKLVLLVDLDQTVIHTTNDNVPNNIKNIYHFQLYGPHSPWYHTRLRPGTRGFLETMSAYYELHICTFGARNYAHMIAQLLDPDGKFFSHRILSRDECFNATSKTDNLKALFPNGDSMVCIIDDREDVWNMASNLIQVKPYHFFQHTGDINAPPGLSKHELDGEGVDFKDLSNLSDDKEKPEECVSETPAERCEAKAAIDCSQKNDTLDSDVNMDVDKPSSSTSAQQAQNSANAEIEETPKNPGADTSAQVTSTTEKEETPEAPTTTTPTSDEAKNDATPSSSSNCHNRVPPVKANKRAGVAPKMRVAGAGGAMPNNAPKQIEIEDVDDYLVYLEVILKSIHDRFYKIFDETHEIPDLKIIVPKIRSEVLRGRNLVFSGLVPTHMKLEQSRAYFIARSLGANVSQYIGSNTTHLVAVTAGTFKVNAAKKNPKIAIVNANWLWCCAERWECVEEKLFPLDRKLKGKQRQPPAHCHSPEHVINYSDKSEISSSSCAQMVLNAIDSHSFINTLNPLLSFSHADLDDMNKEFHQFFESDTSSDDEPINIENPPVGKDLRKRKREENDEERTRKLFSQPIDASAVGNAVPDVAVGAPEISSNEEENEEDDEDESPSAKFRRGEQLPSDIELGSDSNDSDNANPDSEDDGDWNMMGAALEREFLGLED